MRIIYFLFLLLVFACKKNYSVDITHFSLEDNESMVYENYIKQSHIQKQNAYNNGSNISNIVVPNASNYSYFINENTDVNCLYNCPNPPLKIGVVPMSFSQEGIMREIENTIAFVNSNVNTKQYNIYILNKEELESLEFFAPDIIVGPFKDEDVKEIAEILEKQNLQTPVVSLATNVVVSNPDIYYFGFSNDDIAKSTIESTNKIGFENYGILMPNSAVGSATYNLFKKHIEDSGKGISRVEFYDESSMHTIDRFLEKLQISLNQKYFIAEDGAIVEDSYSFTKNIKQSDDKTVTMKDGKIYEKAYKKMDAIIIDASDENFEAIIKAVVNNKAFDGVQVIGSPRIVDGVVIVNSKESFADISKPVLFPANYEFYSRFYLSYLNQFGKKPTRLSTTLYETLVYLMSIHEKKDITKGFDVYKIPEFSGLNGNIVINGKSVVRFTDLNEFKNGEVNYL